MPVYGKSHLKIKKEKKMADILLKGEDSSTNEFGTPSGTTSSGTTSAEKNKVCSVCGDKALGYNFNAVTCESCKAFFRRNALKSKVIFLSGKTYKNLQKK